MWQRMYTWCFQKKNQDIRFDNGNMFYNEEGYSKMEKVILDPAIKFGAGRYRQGKDVLEVCGEEIRRFGKKAFIIAGKRAWDAVKDRILPGFEAAGLEYVLELYSGKCSYEAAAE